MSPAFVRDFGIAGGFGAEGVLKMPLIRIMKNTVGNGVRITLDAGNNLLVGPDAVIQSFDTSAIQAFSAIRH
jgi:hypothetical protein